jgi:omega-amidase
MEAFLKINLIQSNLVWEDIDSNLSAFQDKISRLPEKSDLIILPEMFNTGFSMSPHFYAETMDGKTMQWMKSMAGQTNGVITGSFIVREHNRYYNRLIWMQPDGNYFTYDKKHLFSIAGENTVYTAGNNKLIVELRGWKICPLICYDLRFPAWCRNEFTGGRYAYDLLIFIANWPAIRSHAWKSLLVARAIENVSYVAGVNRVGEDGNNITHSGDSMLIDAKGDILYQANPGEETNCSVSLDAGVLKNFRNQFMVGPDWDQFSIY